MGSVGIRANRCALCGRGIKGTPVQRGGVRVHLACSIRADENQVRLNKHRGRDHKGVERACTQEWHFCGARD